MPGPHLSVSCTSIAPSPSWGKGHRKAPEKLKGTSRWEGHSRTQNSKVTPQLKSRRTWGWNIQIKISPLPTSSPKTGSLFLVFSLVQLWLLMASCLQTAPCYCWKSHLFPAATMTCPLQGSALSPRCPESTADLASLCQPCGSLGHSELSQGQGLTPLPQLVPVLQTGQNDQAASSLPLCSLQPSIARTWPQRKPCTGELKDCPSPSG